MKCPLTYKDLISLACAFDQQLHLLKQIHEFTDISEQLEQAQGTLSRLNQTIRDYPEKGAFEQ